MVDLLDLWGPINQRDAGDPYSSTCWQRSTSLGVKQLRADNLWYVARVGGPAITTVGAPLEAAKAAAEMLARIEEYR